MGDQREPKAVQCISLSARVLHRLRRPAIDS
jgi:hypothetical protein